jgi:hypothetical protein
MATLSISVFNHLIGLIKNIKYIRGGSVESSTF